MSKDNFKQINFEALKFIMLPSDKIYKRQLVLLLGTKLKHKMTCLSCFTFNVKQED